jgi:arsenate reductase (thioredoxin)
MIDNPVEKQQVLFLCTGNSARSQMAEAFLRNLGSDRFEVHSAGLEPRQINPLAVQVMEEAGISMKGHHSKSLSEFLGKVPVRFAIIVCDRAEKACPKLWPFGATVLSWPFDDPATAEGSLEVRLEKFRDVRNQIENRIRLWLAQT